MARMRLFCSRHLVLALALGSIAGCRTPPPEVRFLDATDHSGISFAHENGAAGHYFLIETMGSGGAFADFDGDGDLDIYLIDGFDLSGIYAHPVNLARRDSAYYWVRKSQPIGTPRSGDPAAYAVSLAPAAGVEISGNALYRNEGDGTFVEVGAAAGVDDKGYGMGCAVADYDNDGDQDLYVTNYGRNTLYRNRGDGTFVDATTTAGVQAPQWSTSAAFFDYDNDGHLDLYIANYVDFTIATNKVCGGFIQTNAEGLRAIGRGTRSYCAPSEYQGVPDVLYHNEGNGAFADVSIQSGIANPAGKGLGVLAWDYDEDGDQDLYVANDGVANFLYQNQGDGTFVDVALQAGVAYNLMGESEAGMGVDIGDCDNDGDFDLFVTNFSHETNTLYRNDAGRFKDVTTVAGLGQPSWRLLGFGTNFLDYDNDGDLDLYVANGHVLDRIALFQPGVEYAQEHQLFRNDGTCRYEDISAAAGDWFARKQISRGAAFGDYDEDGDLDLLVNNCGGAARLVRNENGNAQNWSTIRVVGRRGNKDAVGARVRLVSGNRSQIRQVRRGSSYLSASDPRLHIGLGSGEAIDLLEVEWPGGRLQRFRDLPVNTVLIVEEARAISYE